MSCDNFPLAINTVLLHEGGYVNNPKDPGGATNYGISLRFLKQAYPEALADFDFDHDGDVDAADMRLLPQAKAIEIYREQFWDRYGYSRIDGASIATKVFDLCVNMGPKHAHQIVQRAADVKDDGVLGPASFKAINARPSADLLNRIRHEAVLFYERLIKLHPDFDEFRAGWIRRALS